MSGNTSAEVKAQVNLLPAKSQVFLVAMLFVVLAALGFTYLTRNGPIAWAFFLFACGSLAAGVWAWRAGQHDADLDQSSPTTVSWADGTRLTTDSRVLNRPESMLAITQMVEQILQRKPLPEPSGMLDANRVPIPGSEAAAKELVAQTNADTQSLTNAIIDQLDLSDSSPTGVQGPSDLSIVPEGIGR